MYVSTNLPSSFPSIMASEMSELHSPLQLASKSWGSFNWESKTKQWESTTAQSKEAREQSLAARKQLAETTKQFKKSVKNVEQVGASLATANTTENAAATVKAIEALAKNCRQTVKAYQGRSIDENVHTWFVAHFLGLQRKLIT